MPSQEKSYATAIIDTDNMTIAIIIFKTFRFILSNYLVRQLILPFERT